MIAKLCKFIVDMTASEKTLACVIVIQTVWMIVGTITKFDPPPFTLMLTISNVLQLVLIFVLAVAQKQTQNSHDELHDKHDDTHELVKAIHDLHFGDNQKFDGYNNVELSQGEDVRDCQPGWDTAATPPPKPGDTIQDERENDAFKWLRKGEGDK